jgi:hypothetical protein
MEKFVLSLVGSDSPELHETLFFHPLIGEEKRCIRGRESGAYLGYSTFQWTKAVQALCLLFVKARIRAQTEMASPYRHAPIMIGGESSLALSLDYAIEKQTCWLMDMFGCDACGGMLAKRIIARSNPRKRRSGPVAISLNFRVLPLSAIQIFHNFRELKGLNHLRQIESAIEASWSAVSLEADAAA